MSSTLLDQWEVRISKTHKKPYFFNVETQESSWDRPKELTEEDDKKLRGAELLQQAPTLAWRASHILVKHKGSRRPSSWREATITRTEEEAVEILRKYKKQIDEAPNADRHAKFAEIASQYSDCSSHSKSGDLGRFFNGQMQKPFEDAVADLKPGFISDVVTTESGVHLILRTE